MRLTLSTRFPRNSIYFTDTGQILYDINEPSQLISSTTTINKVMSTVNGASSGNHERFPNPYLPVYAQYLRFCSQVEFRMFHPSRFRYNGVDVSAKEYFHKEGWWKGSGRRIFTASDGKEYRWRLHAYHLEMVTNDKSKTQLVEFKEQRQGLGPFRKARPATLEIDPSCVPILDEIIMTFIFCQRLREVSEGNSGGGGGGGDGDGDGDGDGGGDGGGGGD